MGFILLNYHPLIHFNKLQYAYSTHFWYFHCVKSKTLNRIEFVLCHRQQTDNFSLCVLESDSVLNMQRTSENSY
jgi:hypothetical protein